MSNSISKFNIAVGGIPGGDTPRTINSVDSTHEHNAIKEFILRSVSSSKNDFCCACCAETSGIIDEKPESILIVTRDATRIAEGYPGCRYIPIQNKITFNMNWTRHVIFVVNDTSPVFSMEFVDETLSTIRYTQQGLPVMSEELFVLTALYTRSLSPEIYKRFILPQFPDQAIERYAFNRCGIKRKVACESHVTTYPTA